MEDRLSALATEIRRLDSEIESLDQKEIHKEIAIGKIMDADVAAEVVNSREVKLKSDVALSCISKSTRIVDSLISLQHNITKEQ